MEGAQISIVLGVRGPARNVSRGADMLIDAHLRDKQPRLTRRSRSLQ